MSMFFIVAGVVVTIPGIVAIAIITGVYVAVKFFGGVLTFGTVNEEEEDDEQTDK